MRCVVSFSLLALVLTACVREPYRRPTVTAFPAPAPRHVMFDPLVRHAMSLGYVVIGADPARSVFHVQSRMLGRPIVRTRWAARRYATTRSTAVLTVVVQDQEVRIAAQGRFASADGRLHPTLAQEVEILTHSLQRAAHGFAAQRTAGGAMPPPPPGYAAPSGYGVPPGYAAPRVVVVPPGAPQAAPPGHAPPQPAPLGYPPQPAPGYPPAPPEAPPTAPTEAPAPAPPRSRAQRLGDPQP